MRKAAFVSLLTTTALILTPTAARAAEGGSGEDHHHCKPSVSVTADRNVVTIVIAPDQTYRDSEPLLASDPIPDPEETPVVMPTDFPTEEPTEAPTPIVMPTDLPTDEPTPVVMPTAMATDEPAPYVMPTDLATVTGDVAARSAALVEHPKPSPKPTPKPEPQHKCNPQAAKYTVWLGNKEVDWGATNRMYTKTMTVDYGSKVAAAAWQGDARAYDEVRVNRMAPTAPQNLHDTEITKTSVTLDWTPPASDGGSPVKWYAVHYLSGGEDTVFTTSYKASNLVPGTKYTFEVWAVNEIGASPGSVITVWTEPQPVAPDPATNLAVADVTQTAMTATWDAPKFDGGAPITGYRVEVDGKVVTTTGASERSFRLTGLLGGTDYKLAVYALNELGEAKPVELTASTLPATAPGPIQDLQVAKVTADSVAITWKAPVDDGGRPVTAYVVDATDEEGHVRGAMTKGEQYTVTKLDSATKYTISVSAKNAVGASDPVKTSVRTIMKPVPRPDYPGVPQGLGASAVTYTSFQLAWSAPAKSGSAPIRDYEVDINGDAYQTTAGRGVTVSDLVAGRTYHVQVRARNQDGYWGGPAELEVTTTPLAAPGAVRDLATASPKQTSMTLNWKEPSDTGGSPITNYHVSWGADPRQSMDTKTESWANVTGLTPATEYTFTVVAENAQGGSPKESVQGLTNMDPVPEPERPLPPRNLAGSGVTKSTITLTWDTPAGDGGSAITGYRIFKDGTQWAQTEPEERTFEFTTLTAGQTYAFDVQAVNVMGESDKASISVTTSAPTAPSVVQDAKTGEVTQTTIAASWAPPLDDGGRRILDYTVSWTDGQKSTGSLVAVDENALIPGLLEATEYTITLQARNAVGLSDPVTLTATTLFTPVPTKVPAAPRSVSPSKVEYTGLRLTWQGPDVKKGDFPILGYQVFVDGAESVYTAGRETMLDGLESGRTYRIGVAAQNTIGMGSTTDVLVTMKSPTKPTPPVGLNATGPTETSMTLNWSKPKRENGSPIKNYHVDWFATSDHADSGSADTGTETSAEITGLKAGTEYTFRVYAVNGIGASGAAVAAAWTNMHPVPTPTPPAPPRGFRTGAVTQTTATVSWIPPNDNGGADITSYRLTWSGGWKTVNPNANATTIEFLEPATTYTVSLTAVNQMGASTPVSTTVLTNMNPVPEPELPSEPRNLAPASIGADTVALTWDAPIKDGGASVFEYLIRWGGAEARVSAEPATVVSGLRPSTAYTFEVLARNSMGYGPATSVTVTTKPAPTPTPGPGPAPKPTPITPAATGTNVNGTLNADADPRSLRQTVTGRWPANTTMLSGKTKLVERKSQLVSNAGQNAVLAVTYRSPSVQKAALVLNPTTKEWTLRVWLKPKKVSGSVIVTASAPGKTVNGVRYEPLQASKKFIIKDSSYKRG